MGFVLDGRFVLEFLSIIYWGGYVLNLEVCFFDRFVFNWWIDYFIFLLDRYFVYWYWFDFEVRIDVLMFDNW